MNMNSNNSHVYNTNTSHTTTLVNNNIRHNDSNNNTNNDISFYNSNKAPILQQTTAPVISARFDAYEDIFISNESEEYGLEISQFMSEMEVCKTNF